MKLRIDLLLKETENISDRGVIDLTIERIFGVSTQRILKVRPSCSTSTFPTQHHEIPCIRFTIDGDMRLSKARRALLDQARYDVTIIPDQDDHQEGGLH
jgi:hypothetical protein